MKSGVYSIHNTLNGKFYVGSSVNVQMRFSGHRSDLRRGIHDNKKLQYAWNKYGESTFRFEYILFCEISDLLVNEQILIDETKAVEYGYNICPVAGNTIGVKPRPESLEKMAAAQRGRKHSEETRRKMSESAKRHVRTKEHNENLRLACIGKKMPPMTEEQKKKISAANKGRGLGRIKTDRERALISAAMKGRKFSEDTMNKLRESGRKRWVKLKFKRYGDELCQK